MEFPIIDGIPVIVADVAGYLSGIGAQLLRRHDLSPLLMSLIGDALGPGSEFDSTRQQLSIYCESHYRDLLATDTTAGPACDVTTGLRQCLDGIALAHPVIDVGCSVGRGTIDLAARSGGLVLGVDLNFPMLQLAQQIVQTGHLRFDQRRVGLVYEAKEIEVDLPGQDAVDFWACDALALPFSAGTFGAAAARNVLDCVSSPLVLLAELGRVLATGGLALVETPYDWSPHATVVSQWLGGHSQRGPLHGASDRQLRTLLASTQSADPPIPLEVAREPGSQHWHLRLHDRAVMSYESDAVLLRKR